MSLASERCSLRQRKPLAVCGGVSERTPENRAEPNLTGIGCQALRGSIKLLKMLHFLKIVRDVRGKSQT
jgi:hypothetical protein